MADELIYPAPEIWEWKSGGLEQEDTIQDYITADKWNNSFLPQLKKYLEWKNQAEYSIPNEMKVKQGDLITAYKFNLVAEACGAPRVNRGDLITAKVFNNLAKGVSGNYDFEEK